MREDQREISREDREECLEALYRLENEGRTASLNDLMAQADLAERPVTDTLMELALDGKITLEDEIVSLTPQGRSAGQRIFERHELAEKLLCSLGLRQASAHAEACRVEHLEDEAAVRAACCRLSRFGAMLDGGAIRLCDAGSGEYRIVLLSAGRFQRRRLEDMGLGPGALVRVERRQHHGPIAVEAHGARLALGRGVAAKILVAPVTPCETHPTPST